MSYENLAAERRSPSSDEFEVADDKTVSFHAPVLLEEMANRNFEGPPHATSGSSKTATQSCIASLLTQKNNWLLCYSYRVCIGEWNSYWNSTCIHLTRWPVSNVVLLPCLTAKKPYRIQKEKNAHFGQTACGLAVPNWNKRSYLIQTPNFSCI